MSDFRPILAVLGDRFLVLDQLALELPVQVDGLRRSSESKCTLIRVSSRHPAGGRYTLAKGLAKATQPSADRDGEPATGPEGKSIEKDLQSLKWNLWHGNVERALERIEDLQWDLELTAGEAENRTKLLKQLGEFNGCIRNNREFIPNYGERYRNKKRIWTGFVESTVNQMVSRRTVKRQQMSWTERGAHLLLQTRTRGLNGELEETFRRWYPQFRPEPSRELKAAA
jgi:hypothetical protein